MADLVITAANVVKYALARSETGMAGEAITAGQTLYKHTDNEMYKADCSTLAKAACAGVALHAAAEGQPIAYAKSGGINPGAVVVVGTVYGVTDTPGGIGPISERGAADFITILGVAITTSRIELAINASGVAVPA